MPSPSRPTVVDLAYGQVLLDGRSADVTALLESVDAATVVVAGSRRYVHQAWQSYWADLGLPDHDATGPLPVVLGHPSTWGTLRTSALSRSFADLGVPVSLLPRAVLIARSHSDGAMQRCAVVETTHLPSLIVDPARPRRTTWDVTRLRRTAAGWGIEASDVLEPEGTDLAARTEAVVDDSVEAVFVDGALPEEVTRAVDVVSTYALAGRVVPVDRDLIRRYGWRSGRADSPDSHGAVTAIPADDGSGGGRTTTRWIWAAGAVAVVIALIAAGVGFLQRDGGDAVTDRTATVGRTSLVIPSEWRQSELGTAPGRDGPSRTVFADPDTGRRILLVQSEVRSDSTLASVATSLGNRIRQRGDDVVTEFSPSTRFMGRDVISYREAPASGSGIRWYVLVADGMQVSIGCQSGNAGESVDPECARAVSTVQIAS
ncbi:type VII secretion-associated protein [Gordonia sp. OPL2]|uniref:type VII secretion-associated protein n=1 Tax=Gordonia sp. OPL2 TaxID=2486274 RepID=UPI0021CCC1CF|nr:type VII secretion-associated protein [Gordonia sp. OPL2]